MLLGSFIFIISLIIPLRCLSPLCDRSAVVEDVYFHLWICNWLRCLVITVGASVIERSYYDLQPVR